MIDERRSRLAANQAVNSDGRYVLYWMTAARRTRYNDSLQRAVEWSLRLNKPLVVLEAVSIDYPWASVRHHHFIVDGMKDKAQAYLTRDVAYYQFVEQATRGGRGLVLTLAQQAAVVVTDYFPCFFLPRIVEHVAARVSCRMEAVDSNGVLPVNASGKPFTSAYNFRRFMQKHVVEALALATSEEPLNELPAGDIQISHMDRLNRFGVDASILKRYPPAQVQSAQTCIIDLVVPSLDTSVSALKVEGGQSCGLRLAQTFVETRLSTYTERRNKPQESGTSGLTPYLQYGQVSSLEIVQELHGLHG